MNEKNPYKKTDWIDHIVDPTEFERDENGNIIINPITGKPEFKVIDEGTEFSAENMNNIEGGIYELFDRSISLERRQERTEVRLALMDRSNSGNVFFDPLDGAAPNKMVIDATKANITEAITIGATTLKVDDTTGFIAFTEVTIYDDVAHEDVLITAVDPMAKTITVQATANSYKKGAVVCRSSVELNFDKQEMNTAVWGTFSVEGVN